MPPLKELLTERMHLMLSKTMRNDIERCRVKLGARSESDIVRRAVARFTAEELGAPVPPASDASTGRYAGRTRLLVDTAAPRVEPLADDTPDREKRVGTPREPARIRPGAPQFEPFDDVDLTGFREAFDEDVRQLAELSAAPTAVEVFDAALSSLGLDPERIAVAGREKAPGEVCPDCFCLAPSHSSVCPSLTDAASA